MVYFAAEVAGYHVTHIDGGLVESVKDARTTYWKPQFWRRCTGYS